jgi:hypothetical protein
MSAVAVAQPVTGIEDRLRDVCGRLNLLHAELVALTAEPGRCPGGAGRLSGHADRLVIPASR